jgi:hypothetical protein
VARGSGGPTSPAKPQNNVNGRQNGCQLALFNISAAIDGRPADLCAQTQGNRLIPATFGTGVHNDVRESGLRFYASSKTMLGKSDPCGGACVGCCAVFFIRLTEYNIRCRAFNVRRSLVSFPIKLAALGDKFRWHAGLKHLKLLAPGNIDHKFSIPRCPAIGEINHRLHVLRAQDRMLKGCNS